MRKILAPIWLLLSLLCAASAQVPMTGGGLGSPTTAVVFNFSWLIDQVDATAGPAITYNCGSSCTFGAADSNRVIAVYAAGRLVTVNAITSVTIGGVAATLASGSVFQDGGTNGSNSAIYYASVPTGTTGTVVVTWGAAVSRSCISIYRVITATPTPAATANAGTLANVTLTLNNNSGGFVGGFNRGTTTAFTWGNATSDFSANAGGTSSCSSATITANNPTSSSSNQSTYSAASWN